VLEGNSRLKGSHAIVKVEYNDLMWTKNPILGFYIPVVGYKAMFGNEIPKDIEW